MNKVQELGFRFKVQRLVRLWRIQGYHANALVWRLEVGGDNKLENFITAHTPMEWVLRNSIGQAEFAEGFFKIKDILSL
jgi:hypothetical protein